MQLFNKETAQKILEISNEIDFISTNAQIKYDMLIEFLEQCKKFLPSAEKPVQNKNTRVFLNPLWPVEIYSLNGELITRKPFSYFIHSHLKDYFLDPDTNMVLALDGGVVESGKFKLILNEDGSNASSATLPLYISEDNPMLKAWNAI